MCAALNAASAETAALIAAECGGDVDIIRPALLDHGEQALDAMQTALKKAGFLVTPIAKLLAMAALVPPNDPEPPEPESLRRGTGREGAHGPPKAGADPP